MRSGDAPGQDRCDPLTNNFRCVRFTTASTDAEAAPPVEGQDTRCRGWRKEATQRRGGGNAILSPAGCFNERDLGTGLGDFEQKGSGHVNPEERNRVRRGSRRARGHVVCRSWGSDGFCWWPGWASVGVAIERLLLEAATRGGPARSPRTRWDGSGSGSILQRAALRPGIHGTSARSTRARPESCMHCPTEGREALTGHPIGFEREGVRPLRGFLRLRLLPRLGEGF